MTGRCATRKWTRFIGRWSHFLFLHSRRRFGKKGELSKTDATPFGVEACTQTVSQGSRETRQPWAIFRNRFAVLVYGTLIIFLESSHSHIILALSRTKSDNHPDIAGRATETNDGIERIGKILAPRRQNLSHHRADQDPAPGEGRPRASTSHCSSCRW